MHPSGFVARRLHMPACALLAPRRAVLTKGELTGSLGVYAERLAADRELFRRSDVQQLEVLAAESQALVDRAMAMVKANALTAPTSTRRSKAPLTCSRKVLAARPCDKSSQTLDKLRWRRPHAWRGSLTCAPSTRRSESHVSHHSSHWYRAHARWPFQSGEECRCYSGGICCSSCHTWPHVSQRQYLP